MNLYGGYNDRRYLTNVFKGMNHALDPFEEATTINQLIEYTESLGHSRKEALKCVSVLLKISTATIYKRLALLSLDKEVQMAMLSGKILMTSSSLLGVHPHYIQRKALNKALKEQEYASVKQIREAIDMVLRGL